MGYCYQSEELLSGTVPTTTKLVLPGNISLSSKIDYYPDGPTKKKGGGRKNILLLH